MRTTIRSLIILLALIAGLARAAEPTLFAGDVRLILPKVVRATPGVQANIYFDSIVLVINSDNYVFDVTCPKGNPYSDFWTWTPKPEDAGDYPFTIEVRDQANKVIARAQTTIRVASAEASGTITYLPFGDSHLQRDVYPQTILDLAKADPNVDVTLIGCRGRGNKPPADDLRHEGYNGWTAEAFATMAKPKPRTGNYVPGETGSPFLYTDADGKSKLDFAAYCKEFNNSQPPDFVTLELGANDIFTATDEEIDARIDKVFGFFDQLVEMVHTLNPKTRMAIVTVTPPTSSQDGFRNYTGARSKQTRWQFRRNEHRMIEREIERYSNRESEELYLIPVYLQIDPARAFVKRSLPVNSRMPAPEARVIDGVHLSPEGYMQLGDSIYAWIKCSLPPKSGAATKTSQ